MNIKNVMDLELQPNQAVLIKLDHTGDERFEWDPSNPTSVDMAREVFKRFRDQGRVAYSVKSSKDDPQGRAGEILHQFDGTARRIIFRPPMQGGIGQGGTWLGGR